MKCPSCRGALPGGCSTCRPMASIASLLEATIRLNQLVNPKPSTPTYRTEASFKADAFPVKSISEVQ